MTWGHSWSGNWCGIIKSRICTAKCISMHMHTRTSLCTVTRIFKFMQTQIYSHPHLMLSVSWKDNTVLRMLITFALWNDTISLTGLRMKSAHCQVCESLQGWDISHESRVQSYFFKPCDCTVTVLSLHILARHCTEQISGEPSVFSVNSLSKIKPSVQK